MACMLLSVELARPFASDIAVYTDSAGEKALRKFGFKDRVETLLDELPDWATPQMFALPKMFVISKLGGPAIHLDHDAFVQEDFSGRHPDADIVAEFLETPDTDHIHPHGSAMYFDAYERMVKQVGEEALEFACYGPGKNLMGYNCGFININNVEVARTWASASVEAYSKFAGKQFDHVDNVVLEQASLNAMAQKMGWDVKALFDPGFLPDGNYYHVLGHKQSGYHRVAPMVFSKLQALNPLSGAKMWKRLSPQERKNIRSEEVFCASASGKSFSSPEIEKQFWEVLPLFVCNAFHDSPPTNATFGEFRKTFCEATSKHQICSEDGSIDLSALADAVLLDRSATISCISSFLLGDGISLEDANAAAKNAILGKLMSKANGSGREPKGDFSFSGFKSRLLKTQRDLFEALDHIQPNSSEELPKLCDTIVEMALSREPDIIRNLNGFMARKSLRIDTRKKKVLRYEVPETMQASKGPSISQMAKNLGAAAVDFAKSGFSMATPDQVAYRMDICSRCEFWKPDARFGLGKCLKCGCTSMKQKIASSVCPIGSWPAFSSEEVQSNYIPSTNPYRSSS